MKKFMKKALSILISLTLLTAALASCNSKDDGSSIIRKSAVGDAWAKLVDGNEFGAVDVISELGKPSAYSAFYNDYFDHVIDTDGINALLSCLKKVEDHIVSVKYHIVNVIDDTGVSEFREEESDTVSQDYSLEDDLGSLIFFKSILPDRYRTSSGGYECIFVHFTKNTIHVLINNSVNGSVTGSETVGFELDCDTTDLVNELQNIYDKYKTEEFGKSQ